VEILEEVEDVNDWLEVELDFVSAGVHFVNESCQRVKVTHFLQYFRNITLI
jgi:hypothetical protein